MDKNDQDKKPRVDVIPDSRRLARTARKRKRIDGQPKHQASDPVAVLFSKHSDAPLSRPAVKEILEEVGVKVSNEVVAKLVDYMLMVRDWNAEINLVSRMNVDRVIFSSLWESAAILKEPEALKGTNLLDLGTGGGFPGIVLAIMCPELKVTLLDSRRAKTLALRRIVDDLGLSDTQVIHDRAETLFQHSDERYSIVTARAVGVLKELCPWAENLLEKDGTFLAWKGPEGMREFRDIAEGTWKLQGRVPFLPHRSVMILKKT